MVSKAKLEKRGERFTESHNHQQTPSRIHQHPLSSPDHKNPTIKLPVTLIMRVPYGKIGSTEHWAFRIRPARGDRAIEQTPKK
jgi:hypothetical protein